MLYRLGIVSCLGLVCAMVGCGDVAQEAAALLAQGRCRDDDGTRRLRWPEVGAMRISEVMADPPGPDAEREWLELFARTAEPVDLAGLTLRIEGATRPRRWSIEGPDCVAAAPAAFVVVGIARPGRVLALEGIEADAVARGATLPNGALTLVLEAGGEVIDRFELPAARSGISWSRAHDALRAGTSEGCWSRTPFLGSQRATPGVVNDRCLPGVP